MKIYDWGYIIQNFYYTKFGDERKADKRKRNLKIITYSTFLQHLRDTHLIRIHFSSKEKLGNSIWKNSNKKLKIMIGDIYIQGI